MSDLIINDIFDELKDENKRLINELKVLQKTNKILEKYRNCLLDYNDKCDCYIKINNKIAINLLENEYKSVKNNSEVICNNNKNFLKINDMIVYPKNFQNSDVLRKQSLLDVKNNKIINNKVLVKKVIPVKNTKPIKKLVTIRPTPHPIEVISSTSSTSIHNSCENPKQTIVECFRKKKTSPKTLIVLNQSSTEVSLKQQNETPSKKSVKRKTNKRKQTFDITVYNSNERIEVIDETVSNSVNVDNGECYYESVVDCIDENHRRKNDVLLQRIANKEVELSAGPVIAFRSAKEFHMKDPNLARITVGFKCNADPNCQYVDSDKASLMDHIRIKHFKWKQNQIITCLNCNYTTTNKKLLDRHQATVHRLKCSQCEYQTQFPHFFIKHINERHSNSEEIIISEQIDEDLIQQFSDGSHHEFVERLDGNSGQVLQISVVNDRNAVQSTDSDRGQPYQSKEGFVRTNSQLSKSVRTYAKRRSEVQANQFINTEIVID